MRPYQFHNKLIDLDHLAAIGEVYMGWENLGGSHYERLCVPLEFLYRNEPINVYFDHDSESNMGSAIENMISAWKGAPVSSENSGKEQ